MQILSCGGYEVRYSGRWNEYEWNDSLT
jgi:hypothetical protein